MNRKVLGVAGAAILALIAIWYVALFAPQGKALASAQARADAARQKQTELRAQLRSLQVNKSTSAAIQAQIDALKQAVPDSPQLASFIDQVNGAVASSGVELGSIAPTPPAAGTGGLENIRVAMTVKGSYFQIIDFVNRVNAMPRLVVIDSMNLNADKQGSLSAQLNTRLFVQPATAATTKGATSNA